MTDTLIIRAAGKLLKAGMSAKETATVLNIPATTVYNWRRSMGFSKGKLKSQIQSEPEHLSNGQIAKKYGVSRCYVWKVRKKEWKNELR